MTILRKFCVLCITAAAVLVFTAQNAEASSVTDTISIYIGYFGWSEDEYIEKATYTWQELDDMFGGALTTHETVYSYYSGSRTYLAAARGFYIKDLLRYAGVDFGSIARIDFFTKDQTVGAYRTFTKESLFDMPRYYFPNMAADEETGGLYPYNGGDIHDGAVLVEPMLALEDYTEWDSPGVLFERAYKNTMFSAGSRFHLFFGQLDPTEANTSSAAKYVHKLLITFSGTPVFSTGGETNIDLTVGSDFRMSLNITSEDALLDSYVRDNITWSSSDESVVTVDGDGVLTPVSAGEAVITAVFGESSISQVVKIDGSTQPQETSPPQESEHLPPEAYQEAAPSEQFSEAPPETKPAEPASLNAPEETRTVYELSKELMSQDEYALWINSILEHEYIENNGEGGLNNARREKMDEEAVQLIVPERELHDYTAAVSLTMLAFFALGFGGGILSFRRKLVT